MEFSPDYPNLVTAYENVTTAVLHDLLSERGDENAQYYDADRDLSRDTVVLAARALYRAVEALPRDDKPIGWNTKPSQGRVPVSLSRDDLTRLIDALYDSSLWLANHAPASTQEEQDRINAIQVNNRGLLERLRQERAAFDRHPDSANAAPQPVAAQDA